MRDGNKQSVVTKLKREIIKRLYECPEIIQMLDHPDVDPECPDTAEWTCIFPFIKLLNTQQEVHTYIGVAIDCDEPIYNDIYKRLDINVTIFCPVTIMRVDGQKGTRTDIIAGDISELLNWNSALGFEIRLDRESEGVLSAREYYFRTLHFTALRPNDLVNSEKRRH